jgi:hypothetical protein
VIARPVSKLPVERYDRLVIEVDDPRATAASINQALGSGPGRGTTTG